MTRVRWNGALILGLLAAVATVGLGVWGWTGPGGDDPLDALYKALQAFVLSENYSDLEQAADARLPLEAARWLGALFAFYAILVLVWSSLGLWRLGLVARGRRGHLVVAGATVFADRLSETAAGGDLKARVIQLRAPDQRPYRRGRLIRLPFHGFDRDGLDEAGARRARRLLIDLADDGAAVDLALAAQRRYPDLAIVTRLKDTNLLRSLHDLPGGKTLRAFSEAEAAAREVVRRHPLFLEARDRGQGRIHAILVGDDDWLEALLVEIILSSRTLTLAKPVLTVAVAEPVGFRRKLAARYPELDREAAVTVIAFEPATFRVMTETAPEAVTAVFVAFDDGAQSLAAALAVRRQALSWPGFGAFIFTRTSGEQGLIRPAAGEPLAVPGEDAFGGLVSFGSLTDVIHATGVLSEAGSRAERAWHEAYLRLHPSSEAAVPWERLSEEYRLSNRRAVAHVYAKLHDAGFDLRAWLATARPWDELPALAPGETLFRDEAELMRLAELEHERWNADRRLLGWRLGESADQPGKQDKLRKLHPCLIDFADLSPDIQRYDIELIRELDQMLPRKKGGLRRSGPTGGA
ncbi:MAG: hypothetical protein ACK5WW_00015 [Brevundimonas sp.]|jgi:hypothetical protein|uniref:hypothetical protein n=1 Tax=Brevundimonas sp. TaxID=1871086 RepID=UPI0022C53125|nr:hypothetical protein [Brevundimonas sp.]